MFYKQIQVAMLPSFANLVSEALPLDWRVQHRLGGDPIVLKINSDSAFPKDIDLKNPKRHKHLDKEWCKKYLFRRPSI
jgi:hypothetical protein